jgi:CBS-domain-containing membrane protein
MYEVVLGLGRRLRLPALAARHDRVAILGLFAFINGLISIALLSLVAWGTSNPFIFPSLGPTAFLVFYQPLAAASSPRNAIAGHLIGILAGYGSLVIFGLTNLAPASSGGVTVARVGAAALSLAATSGVMVWCRVPHPPAGATTLIVSLGILRRPVELVIVEVAVVLLVAQALGINRLAGLNYPLWAAQGRQDAANLEGDSF